MLTQWCSQTWARGISFALALVGSAVVLIWPRLIAESMQQLDHSVLSFTMLMISGCFVHGVGFDFKHPVLRLLSGPLLLWPVIIGLMWFYACMPGR